MLLARNLEEGEQVVTSDGSTLYTLGISGLTVYDAHTFQIKARYTIQGCDPRFADWAHLGRSDKEVFWTERTKVCRVTLP
jgi:hypothetical protein